VGDQQERFSPSGLDARIPLGIDGYLRSLYDAPMIVERTVSEVVGQTVSALRQATGLTQAELASAMRDMGFAWQRQTVARIERGVRTLNVDELVAVAAYFEMPVQAVLARPEVLGASSAFDEWRPIRIGERLVDVRDWLNAVWQSGRSHDDRPDTATRRAIDAVVGNLRRPWAAYWRRGDDAARAFQRARTERDDRKRSGPIFVVDQDVEIQTTPPLWGQPSVTKLEAGVPYTARDEFEAEAIRQTTNARVVTKQRAYRMRQRA
jgi:transcriptional regulator with XRE-family HTH domain